MWFTREGSLDGMVSLGAAYSTSTMRAGQLGCSVAQESADGRRVHAAWRERARAKKCHTKDNWPRKNTGSRIVAFRKGGEETQPKATVQNIHEEDSTQNYG
jgi:hypothetical protein